MRQVLSRQILRDVLSIKGNNPLIVAPTCHLERIDGIECGDGN